MTLRRAVLLLAAILFLANLWGYDLWAPDEPYFAEGAREMRVDGEWLVPHVNGVITTDKPPLFFWLIALFSVPFGAVGPVPARLVSVCAAVGTLILTMRICRRDADPRTAALAGLVLATTYLFWEKARWAQIDSLLCFLIWVALAAFSAFRAGLADGRRAGWIFWGATALAVLAKGPVGLLLPLGSALITLGLDRNLRSWRAFAPLSGPVLFLTIALGWAVPASLFTDGYSVLDALQEHFVSRGLHGMHHAQPWYYFGKVLPPLLLPWTGIVPGALVLAWRRRSPVDRWLLVTVIFVVVFFSISTEKRELYALPALPAIAMLVARFAGRMVGWESGPTLSRRWLTVGQGIVGTLLMLMGAALPVVAARHEAFGLLPGLALGIPLALAGLVALLGSLQSRPWLALLAPPAGAAVALVLVPFLIYPVIDATKSARPFSIKMRESTAATRAAGHPVMVYDLGNLPEPFAYYSGGVYTLEVNDIARVEAHLRLPYPVHALIDASHLQLLSPQLRETLQIVERTRLSRKDVLLVTNAAPGNSATPD